MSSFIDSCKKSLVQNFSAQAAYSNFCHKTKHY